MCYHSSAFMYKPTIAATLWELSPASPALHCTAVSNIANIFIPWEYFYLFCCCWFLFLLKLARLRVRGDNVVENMPAENENKDLAHNFLHKEFSLRVTMLGSLACRTSSTRLLLSSYSSLYFNNHDSIPSSNLSKHLVVWALRNFIFVKIDCLVLSYY